ncbi:BtpA/SgcQ family protein [Tepidanaerobacter sp. GT38]|uniref:BtpA/SgcQ family protein n=1 Tax=Tepidanaerobacter sp. GT38 TaxID=2722793 RepID=UPI001F2BF3DF|nr:BtpA/SgcQ family protein [Tepidanaerobacter sp. GT38]MCG1013405.1 BtpA/SgcQ family protein [Tepidanaerobacter sp. GT38]
MINHMEQHKSIFKTEKPLIGCVHLIALPGTPYYDPEISLKQQVERAKSEVRALQEAGFDAIIFANEGDRPYVFKVGPEIVASYVRIVTEVLNEVNLPHGCGVLIDPYATLAVAKAIDAKFVRTYVTGTYADTFGFHHFEPGEIYRYRKNISAENVNIYTYFDAHAGTSLDTRDQFNKIDTTLATTELAGILVTGQRAGLAPDFEEVKAIKSKFPNHPVLIASGINESNVNKALAISDGLIVGTCLKKDGILWNPVDPERAKRFVEIAKS